MANTLFVSEFAEAAIGPAGRVSQVPMFPTLVANYTVATATVAATAFNAKTRLVRLHAQTGAMTYTITTAGTIAVATDTRLAANQTEYVAVPLGGGYRVSELDRT
jgi:hypothetical protein